VQDSKYGLPLCQCCQLSAWSRGREGWRRKVQSSERVAAQFQAIFANSVAHAKQEKVKKRKHTKRKGPNDAATDSQGKATEGNAGESALVKTEQQHPAGAVASIMADLGMDAAAGMRGGSCRSREAGTAEPRGGSGGTAADAAQVAAPKAKKKKKKERDGGDAAVGDAGMDGTTKKKRKKALHSEKVAALSIVPDHRAQACAYCRCASERCPDAVKCNQQLPTHPGASLTLTIVRGQGVNLHQSDARHGHGLPSCPTCLVCTFFLTIINRHCEMLLDDRESTGNRDSL
jgi:hypothetical protein